MSVIKLSVNRRRGPWLGGPDTRPSRRASDPEPLFEPEAAAEAESGPIPKGSFCVKKALAACGVALIFLAGLGAGWSVGWSGSQQSVTAAR